MPKDGMDAATALNTPPEISVIPESAPFSDDQRAWLNGFFAGMLSLDVAAQAAPAGAPEDDDDGAPWHDPAMPIDERMALAEERPLPRKLFAAMAQQDCGQCGYLCESYSAALASGAEGRTNLCAPGGKETNRMVKKLLEATPAAAPAADAPAQPSGPTGYCREAPVEAFFRSATRITGEASNKDARHVVFDVSKCLDGQPLDYVPGDSFGLQPTNDPSLVAAVIEAIGAEPDLEIDGKPLSARLAEDSDLGLAPDALFELASFLIGGEPRKKALALARGEDPDGDAETFDVLKTLETFGPLRIAPEALLERLEPLQPRLYSISSCPQAFPGELHLTVDAVRYDIEGRQRFGVASTFLADRAAEGQSLPVYIQKAHGFALPEDPQTPILMCGPGTGIAPFRAFLWRRRVQKQAGGAGPAWLFFGHQREATDFFYREELESFQADGTLTNLSTAWSRDGDQKVYVQDRIREAGAEVWDWFQKGAHFYVCGDASRMAKDVETAVAEVAATHGALGAEGGQKFLADLKAQGRYQADVY